MTVLPADHRADLQKLEKIAGGTGLIGDRRGIRVAVSKLREGSDAAIWQPLRFADLRGQKIDPGRLHRFRSGHSHRRHQGQRSWLQADREAARRRPGDQGASPSSEPQIAAQNDRLAMQLWTAAIPSTDNLFQLPASRTP